MNTPHASTENTTPSTMTCAPETVGKLLTKTLGYQLDHIESNMAVLDHEQQQLMEAASELSELPIPDSAEYKSNGAWLYRGFGVHAIKREPTSGGFQFLAQSTVGARLFNDLTHAFIWLEGVIEGTEAPFRE